MTFVFNDDMYHVQKVYEDTFLTMQLNKCINRIRRLDAIDLDSSKLDRLYETYLLRVYINRGIQNTKSVLVLNQMQSFNRLKLRRKIRQAYNVLILSNKKIYNN